jgi:phosphoglycerate dehydrogenase-like enzyme
LLLAAARHLPEEDQALRTGTWQTSIGVGLAGKTLAILGLGHIGRQVARVGRAFGMRVIAWSQNLTADDAEAEGAELVSKDELFRQADVLTIHLKLGDRTRGLVSRHELRQMKPSAVFVNTSRGAIVDENDLVASLADGEIAAAGLDVYSLEPLPRDHPLRRAPNTVLTPHLGYVTKENYDHFFPEMVKIISAYLKGEPIHVVATPTG